MLFANAIREALINIAHRHKTEAYGSGKAVSDLIKIDIDILYFPVKVKGRKGWQADIKQEAPNERKMKN